MALGEEIELGEVLLIIFLVLYVLDQIKKGLLPGIEAITDRLGFNATVGTTNTFAGETSPGVSKALTPAQARSIAVVATGPATGYILSPDNTVMQFDDGTVYDNGSGHFFDASGNDLGALSNLGGTTGGQQINDPGVMEMFTPG